MRKIRLSQVKIDAKYYPRVNGKADWITVLRYKEALEVDPSLADPKGNRDAFPPIIVVAIPGGGFVLLDGLHRIRAFAAAGQTAIYAEVEKLPKSKWLARSVELNAKNARPFDSGDKIWIHKRLASEGYKIKDIASLLGMKIDSLERITIGRCQKLTAKQAKGLPEGRANRKVNGNHYGFLKAPVADAANTDRAVSALLGQHSISSRTVRQVLDAALAVFENGVIDMTDEQVSEKVARLAELTRQQALV